MSDRRDFLAMVESEEWAGALTRLEQEREQRFFLASLIREISGPEVGALLRDLQVGSPEVATCRVSTQYGGVFLLVPALIEMGLYDFLSRCPYPEPEGISKSGLLLFMIGLQCLGIRNAKRALEDGGLALFAGLRSPLALSQIERHGETLKPEVHEEFNRVFRAYRGEMGGRPSVFMLSRFILSENAEDLGWFLLWSEDEPIVPDPGWDAALSPVSAVVLRGFASKLGRFAESSPEYVRRNFLESHAEIEVSADRLVVHFLTCPLQMVLRMRGFDHATWTVPWLENRTLEFHFD